MLNIKKALTKIMVWIKQKGDLIGSTSMGTTATTITGAIAEHEGDISNLNSKLTSQRIIPTFNITMNNDWTLVHANKLMVTGILRFTTPSTASQDYLVGTMPSGYRPKAKLTFIIVRPWTFETVGILIIDIDGKISLGSNTWATNKEAIVTFSYVL